MRPFRQFSWIALSVAGVLAALSFYWVAAIKSPWQLHLLSNINQAAIVLWATLCTVVVAQRSAGYLRQLWNLWAAALGTLAAGTVLVAYWASFRATPAATPWPSDILNFMWVAPAIMMFVPWSAEERGRVKWQYVLDFMQVGIVTLTAFLYFFYVPAVWEVQGRQMLDLLREVTMARNVLMLSAFALRTATMPANTARRFFAWMTFLFAAVLAFDFTGMFKFGEFNRGAEWMGTTWAIPYLAATVFAAMWDSSQGRDIPPPVTKREAWALSHVLPVLMPLLVILMGSRIAREQMTVAWTTIGFSFACAAARLVLTSAEQHRIAEDLERAEQAMRRSEQKFSKAFHSSPDAMSISLFPEGRILEMNESYARLTGYTREEAIGKVPEELGLWIDAEHMTRLRADFRQQGEIREQEFEFRRKDGELRWASLSATTLNLDGQECGLVIVADITEKKQAQQAVRATEERFRSLVNDLQVGVALVGPKGEIRFANAASRKMFDWVDGTYLGKTVFDLGLRALYEDGTEMPLTERPVARALRTKLPVLGQVIGWQLPGHLEPLWVIGNAIPMLKDDGQVDSVIVSFADITNLRRAQDALRTSEERHRSLIQVLRVGVCAWGPDERCQFVNRALLEMFGITEKQIVGKRSEEVLDAISEDGAVIPQAMRPVSQVIRTREPMRNQVLGWPLPDGRTIWTQVDVVPEISSEGELVRVIASLTNITDRKRVEEEKRISEEMFTKAFHSSPDSMTISTLADGRYLEVNEGYTRMFGWSRDEAVGKTTLELGIWPAVSDRERLKKELFERGRVSQLEFRLRNKSGEMRDIMLSADIIELNGQPCMLAVSDDITEWKAAQQALLVSEERFRTLVEHLAVAVVLHGPDGRIRFVNPAAQNVFGLREELVMGKKPSEIGLSFIDEDGAEIPPEMHPITRALATGRPVQNIVMGWRWHGSNDVVWIFGSVVPQFGPDGKLTAVIASCANITDQKRAEASLRQLSKHLLQLQDEERRRLGRDLHDSLAQSVLAVNLSLAQVTKNGSKLDERSRGLLRQARGLLQDMSRQIRTLSYLLHPPLLDELGLVSATREYAQGFSERSGLRVEVEVSPAFGRLAQEAETALFRIVQESLANIQKHSGSHTARIRLDSTEAKVLLEVSDEGRGIAPERGQELKEPGARFGVGIAGMRERMAQLGGTLEIESDSRGTTIRAALPLRSEVFHAASHTRG